MGDNSLRKMLKKYKDDPTQANYSKVIEEMMWSVVNCNRLYFVESNTTAGMPAVANDADGKKYALIFSQKPDNSDTHEYLMAEAQTLLRNIALSDSYTGIIMDVDTGADCVILTQYIYQILQSAKDYYNGLSD